MKIYQIFLLCLLSYTGNLPLVYLKSESADFQSLLGNYKLTGNTPDPINIDTSKVKKVTTPSPFTIHGIASDIVKIINNGKFVEVKDIRPKSYVTGGILGDKDKYLFYKKTFLWANCTDEIAGVTVDGKGTPLNDLAIFYNEKYGKYENAVGKEDGLVKVIFLIDACPFSIPNFLYIPFAFALRLAQKAGSTSYSILGFAIGWFALIIPYNSIYYAYPGSYIDDETGKQYNDIPVIVIQHLPWMCISKTQYEKTFGSFKDFAGKPLTNVASQFPLNGRPVLQVTGIKNINLP